MKAYSAILKIDPSYKRKGETLIKFDDFPRSGQGIPNATIHEVRQVGGKGKFKSPPAYVAHIREYKIQDKARGGNEYDLWVINSDADRDELQIQWEVKDKGAAVIEIGFLLVGE